MFEGWKSMQHGQSRDGRNDIRPGMQVDVSSTAPHCAHSIVHRRRIAVHAHGRHLIVRARASMQRQYASLASSLQAPNATSLRLLARQTQTQAQAQFLGEHALYYSIQYSSHAGRTPPVSVSAPRPSARKTFRTPPTATEESKLTNASTAHKRILPLPLLLPPFLPFRVDQ